MKRLSMVAILLGLGAQTACGGGSDVNAPQLQSIVIDDVVAGVTQSMGLVFTYNDDSNLESISKSSITNPDAPKWQLGFVYEDKRVSELSLHEVTSAGELAEREMRGSKIFYDEEGRVTGMTDWDISNLTRSELIRDEDDNVSGIKVDRVSLSGGQRIHTETRAVSHDGDDEDRIGAVDIKAEGGQVVAGYQVGWYEAADCPFEIAYAQPGITEKFSIICGEDNRIAQANRTEPAEGALIDLNYYDDLDLIGSIQIHGTSSIRTVNYSYAEASGSNLNVPLPIPYGEFFGLDGKVLPPLSEHVYIGAWVRRALLDDDAPMAAQYPQSTYLLLAE